jgi:uncharacterized membrane protein
MVAAGLTGVYAETIPNVEILTLVVFSAGVLLGARDGALVGAITMIVYSLLNPYGPVHPYVTASQVLGEVAAGLAGAGFAALGFLEARPFLRAALLASCGIIVTAFFDFVTNVASGVVFGQMRATLIGGIPFALIHMGTNAVLFATLGVAATGVLKRYRLRLS